MAFEHDLCIRGAGIVGRTLALLAARERLRVALVAPPERAPGHADVRAYALSPASQALLQSLRCWPAESAATPVLAMQVQADGQGHVHFSADEQGVAALNWIVDVPALEQQLAQAVQYQAHIDVVSAPVAAPLTVVCEGRASTTRTELGVDFDTVRYPQQAIALRLDCERPHGQTARQWFTPEGDILAFLPLDGPEGREVAIVWSVDRNRVDDLLALDDAAFAAHLQNAAHLQPSDAPYVVAVQRRVAWPLQLGLARRWVGSRIGADGVTRHNWALAGDAAHSVHPLAGQGLNLGLADVALLDQIIGGRPYWRSPGDMRLLRQYERARKAETAPLIAGMDGIQRLFSHNAAGVRQLRNLGMSLFERSGPVKDWVARRAMD